MTTSAGRLPATPAAAFVLVWSSGYIAGPAGVAAVEPFALVGARFVLAAVLAAGLALALRRPLRTSRGDLGRIALTGLMLNAVVFGTVYSAFELGTGAVLAALVQSLSPVLTALLAGVLLGERLTRWQVGGFAVGVVGVLVVLGPDLESSGGPVALLLVVASLFGLSLGTLGQRWTRETPDPLWSTAIQCGASAPPLVALSLLLERGEVVREPWPAALSLGWLVMVNSLLGLVLLGLLVRAGGAGAASSLFFLMPPVTAVLAWLVLDESLSVRGAAGLAISGVGVAAATGVVRRRPPPDPITPPA